MAGESIILDGKQLNQIDRNGAWKVNSIDGWWDPPSIRADDVENPFGDGDIPGEIYYQSRILTIKGRVIAKSHEYLHEAMQMLSTVCYRKYAQLCVSGHGPTLTAAVRLNGRVVLSQRSNKYLQFEIPLLATDPYKYGASRQFVAAPGAVEKPFQRGSVEAWPEMTVTGNMPDGYTIRFAGGDVSVPNGIISGTTDRIEYRSRRLYRNGEFAMGVFGLTGFRPCLVGVRHSLELIPVSGSGQVAMKLNDTYL